MSKKDLVLVGLLLLSMVLVACGGTETVTETVEVEVTRITTEEMPSNAIFVDGDGETGEWITPAPAQPPVLERIVVEEPTRLEGTEWEARARIEFDRQIDYDTFSNITMISLHGESPYSSDIDEDGNLFVTFRISGGDPLHGPLKFTVYGEEMEELILFLPPEPTPTATQTTAPTITATTSPTATPVPEEEGCELEGFTHRYFGSGKANSGWVVQYTGPGLDFATETYHANDMCFALEGKDASEEWLLVKDKDLKNFWLRRAEMIIPADALKNLSIWEGDSAASDGTGPDVVFPSVQITSSDPTPLGSCYWDGIILIRAPKGSFDELQIAAFGEWETDFSINIEGEEDILTVWVYFNTHGLKTHEIILSFKDAVYSLGSFGLHDPGASNC